METRIISASTVEYCIEIATSSAVQNLHRMLEGGAAVEDVEDQNGSTEKKSKRCFGPHHPERR